MEVAVDPEKLSRPKFKMFLDNAQVLAGINSDQTFVSQVLLSFSDYLGDRRAFFQFDSVSTFSNFRIGYFNISKRFQWGLQVYDDREYFYGYNYQTGDYTRDQRIARKTGVSVNGSYPISRYTRVEGNVGFLSRAIDVPLVTTNVDGTQVVVVRTAHGQRADRRRRLRLRRDAFQVASGRTAASGSTSACSTAFRLPDGRTTLTFDLFAEARDLPPALAARRTSRSAASAACPRGAVPTVYAFGGLDTLRGYDYRALIGNNVFYLNTEFRFPLIDVLAITGFLQLRRHPRAGLFRHRRGLARSTRTSSSGRTGG